LRGKTLTVKVGVSKYKMALPEVLGSWASRVSGLAGAIAAGTVGWRVLRAGVDSPDTSNTDTKNSEKALSSRVDQRLRGALGQAGFMENCSLYSS
jgi:hypothetical protein